MDLYFWQYGLLELDGFALVFGIGILSLGFCLYLYFGRHGLLELDGCALVFGGCVLVTAGKAKLAAKPTVRSSSFSTDTAPLAAEPAPGADLSEWRRT